MLIVGKNAEQQQLGGREVRERIPQPPRSGKQEVPTAMERRTEEQGKGARDSCDKQGG